ncbi:MAG: DNA primase [Nitrosospira multiformis]|nr:DNA primase [Nitrosospira multiformis]
MSASTLLNRLDGVKQTGKDRWIARCPAHRDKRPSLAIRELDGRTLAHCFAGCETSSVLAAVGLDLNDLFPERQGGYSGQKERKPFYASDILRCVAFEALLVSIAALNVARGVELPEEDRKRLLIAASRLQGAVEACDE